MPLKVIVGSATEDAARMDVYPATTAKRATRIEAYNGSAWKLVQSFIPDLAATAVPDVAERTINQTPPALATTNAVTATPVGGQAPFTYVWSVTSGDGITIFGGLTATAVFRATLDVETLLGSAQCIVTDALGTTATVTCSIILTNNGVNRPGIVGGSNS